MQVGDLTSLAKRPASRRLAALAPIAGVWLALLLFVSDHAFSLYDDAYIYLRYVDNLFAGCGLRFNCEDPPVEGFTGPLWLIALALGRLLTTDAEALTQVLGTASVGAALTVTLLTALRLRDESAAISPLAAAVGIAALLGLDHYVLLNATSGMETALACLAVALVAKSVLVDDCAWLRTRLVLAVLARPECALLVLALPVLPRARSLRYLVPLAVALGAVVLARWLVFHDVLPNTYWAKSGGTLLHARLGLAYIVEVGRDFPVTLFAPLALLLLGQRAGVRYLLLVAAFWLAFFLRTGGDTFYYGRLAMPLVPTLTLLGVLGLGAMVGRSIQGSARRVTAATLVLAASAGLAGLAAWSHGLVPTRGFDNVLRWKMVGRYLAEHHPGESIATVPIGAIGYFSRLHLVDLVGLTSREVARTGHTVPPDRLGRNWIGHERHDTGWVLAQHPDLIVMTKWRDSPWTLEEARAGFFAEWLLMREIKEGRAPYAVENAEIAPGVYWLMFRREQP